MKKVIIPRHSHTLFALLSTSGLFLLIAGGSTALVALQHTSELAAVSSASTPTIGDPILAAKAAVVFDPRDGSIVYAKNPNEVMPLASITKLMTAEILLTAESPDIEISISSHALSMKEAESDQKFTTGDSATLDQLIRIGLVASSNVAMQAAAESLGEGYLSRMNEVARNLGLLNTHFYNPTGLDTNGTSSGAYAGAYDVARLAALFYKQNPEYFTLTRQPSVSVVVGEKTITAKATALPLLSIPGFIGAKTGYTDLAGGNLVALFDVEINHPIIIVVLGSTHEGRFDDVATLISALRKNTSL